MDDLKVKLSKEGRILIPLEIRKALQLHEGDELILRLEDGELKLLTEKMLF
ncbi:AbrB/MazE/SpoVT family DNA-binding domain-containing protein [Paenibacillus koleovorans]|uniref:AbrB/MazE/SpoVT family DNA-binding domain-containing protein n=1 Tax=Paenibacillus koleovorans TaxID=121608 RepID=UPI000FDAA62F|nr:AbrB/MazE/SpoVT family DNA-binding domain-containing protein [Paenibacillus koleovorans]